MKMSRFTDKYFLKLSPPSQVSVLWVWNCAAQHVASPGPLLRARNAWNTVATLTSWKRTLQSAAKD